MARAFTFNPEAHRYEWADNGEELLSVTQILKKAGLTSYGNIPAAVLENAARRGTNVHLATEYDDLGTLETMDAEQLPYVTAWRYFKQIYGFTFTREQIEPRYASEVYNFAGQLDRWTVKNGTLYIIDEKTSKTIQPSAAIQTAAYEELLKENVPEIIGLPVKRWVVQLKDNGTFKVYSYTDPNDRNIFMAATANDTAVLQHWINRHIKKIF